MPYHLAAEFVRYPQECRARKQWLHKHKALVSLISLADRGQAEVVDILNRLRQSHATLWELHQRLFSAQKTNLHPSELTAQQNRIADQLFMVTQNTISDALTLARFSAEQVVGIRDLQDRLIILFTLLLILLLSFFGILMGRQIIRPLDKLKKGTEVIGEGDLDHSVGHISNDELGDLGLAFDHMVSRLQDTLASRDQLNTEVAERKLKEYALRESRARLVHAEHIAHLGSWDWDIVSDEVICSEEVFQIFRVQPKSEAISFDELLGHVHPDDRNWVEDWMRESAGRTGGIGLQEFRLLDPEGDIRIVQADGDVEIDSSSGTAHMVGTLHDITDRWSVENALRESEAKYRNLLENLPQRVFYKDRNSVYLAVNPSYAGDFDLKLDDFVGKDDYAIHSPEFGR